MCLKLEDVSPRHLQCLWPNMEDDEFPTPQTHLSLEIKVILRVMSRGYQGPEWAVARRHLVSVCSLPKPRARSDREKTADKPRTGDTLQNP